MRSPDHRSGAPLHDHTPYLVVDDAQTLIEFAKRAFDAKVGEELKREDGTIMHAEPQIGDSRIMLGQASEQHKAMPCAL